MYIYVRTKNIFFNQNLIWWFVSYVICHFEHAKHLRRIQKLILQILNQSKLFLQQSKQSKGILIW